MARRRGPQGPNLLIPMIIVIVLWLAAGGYGYSLFDEIYNEQTGKSLALYATQQRVAKADARVDMNWVELERMSGYVGFRGAGRFSNPQAVKRVCGPYREGGLPGRGGSGAAYVIHSPADVVTEVAQLKGDTALTVQETIAVQDVLVNRLIDANSLLFARTLDEMAEQRVALHNEAVTIDRLITDRTTTLEGKERELIAQRDALEASEDGRYTWSAELASIYDRIFRDVGGDTSTFRARIRELRQLRADLGEQVEAQAVGLTQMLEAAGRYNRQIANRNEYDGTIYWVDVANRWAYITLGKADGLRAGQTFHVREVVGGTLGAQLATLQVREALSGYTALCDILQVNDQENWPKNGDAVINPQFDTTPYSTFAFIGKFGAGFTAQPRGRLEAILGANGAIVHAQITPETEVLVLGGEFSTDEEYRSIFQDRQGDLYPIRDIYTFMRPEDIYVMYGLDYD